MRVVIGNSSCVLNSCLGIGTISNELDIFILVLSSRLIPCYIDSVIQVHIQIHRPQTIVVGRENAILVGNNLEIGFIPTL